MDFPAINVKAESRPESVPALVTTGPGVDIQDFFGLIIHNLQDVGMPADKDVGPMLPDKRPRLGIIVAGRPADMGHQHFQALALPAAVQRTPVQQPPVVAIADDALQRLEGGDLRLRVQSAPEVPGMPDLVDIPEELLELRRKHAVRIRYESDKHGPAKIANVEFCPKTFKGCGPKEEPIPPSNPGGDSTIPVSEVFVSPASLTLDIGKTATLTASVSPSNATSKTVTWSSSNESVATVANGKVTAVAGGTATITASVDNKSATCSVTVKVDAESAAKAALMKIYNAMDGAHWTLGNKWDVSKPLNDWECVEWDSSKKELKLTFGGVGLQGEFPDCFDELTSLTWFLLQNEPGITGTLPASFAKLKNLKWMFINTTSMTSLPDIFKDIPFTFVSLNGNEKMAGPLPASLPGSNPTSVEVQLWGNAFTGTVPDSWASLGNRLKIENETHLDARVPDSFITAADASYLINMYLELASWRETPIVVGDYDIPAFWPKRGLKDIVTGKSIPYKEICAKNKVTILLNWATWCPFSKEVMPILKRMYEKYHKDGLEIIAAFNASDDTSDEGRPLKDILQERGYDQWYNFNIWDLSTTEWSIWCAGTPSATLVDKDGKDTRLRPR